jgi:hypothetical protein
MIFRFPFQCLRAQRLRARCCRRSGVFRFGSTVILVFTGAVFRNDRWPRDNDDDDTCKNGFRTRNASTVDWNRTWTVVSAIKNYGPLLNVFRSPEIFCRLRSPPVERDSFARQTCVKPPDSLFRCGLSYSCCGVFDCHHYYILLR